MAKKAHSPRKRFGIGGRATPARALAAFREDPARLLDPDAWPAQRRALVEGIQTGEIHLRAGVLVPDVTIEALVDLLRQPWAGHWWKEPGRRRSGRDVFLTAVRGFLLRDARAAAQSADPGRILAVVRAAPDLLRHPDVEPEIARAFIAYVLPKLRATRRTASPSPDVDASLRHAAWHRLIHAGVPHDVATEFVAAVACAREVARFRRTPFPLGIDDAVVSFPTQWEGWTAGHTERVVLKMARRQDPENQKDGRARRKEVTEQVHDRRASFEAVAQALIAFADKEAAMLWALRRDDVHLLVDELAATFEYIDDLEAELAALSPGWRPARDDDVALGRRIAATRWPWLCTVERCTHDDPTCSILCGSCALVEQAIKRILDDVQ